jgi:hypothetical protein
MDGVLPVFFTVFMASRVMAYGVPFDGEILPPAPPTPSTMRACARRRWGLAQACHALNPKQPMRTQALARQGCNRTALECCKLLLQVGTQG